MEVEFFIDKLREELSQRPFQYVVIRAYVDNLTTLPPIHTLRVVAEPKGFLKTVFGKKILFEANVREVGEGKYSIDSTLLEELFGCGIRDADELNSKCQRLIERLTELAEKEEDRG